MMNGASVVVVVIVVRVVAVLDVVVLVCVVVVLVVDVNPSVNMPSFTFAYHQVREKEQK